MSLKGPNKLGSLAETINMTHLVHFSFHTEVLLVKTLHPFAQWLKHQETFVTKVSFVVFFVLPACSLQSFSEALHIHFAMVTTLAVTRPSLASWSLISNQRNIATWLWDVEKMTGDEVCFSVRFPHERLSTSNRFLAKPRCQQSRFHLHT